MFSPIFKELNSFFINVSILDQMLIQTENHAILYFDKSKLPLLFIKSPFMEVNNKISRQLLFPETCTNIKATSTIVRVHGVYRMNGSHDMACCYSTDM